MTRLGDQLDTLHQGRPGLSTLVRLLQTSPVDELMGVAEHLTRLGHGNLVSYSRKVFVPLTELCRDVCHYCTFAKAPRRLAAPYLSIEDAVEIARRGAEAGCREALFTLGDQPELRYPSARQWLAEAGFATTLSYLEAAARAVFERTGLLPHLNPGVMSVQSIDRLRAVSASMGLMLESTSERLCERGGPHWGSPDKSPTVRLATLRLAGERRVPMTTGLLIGIGETRAERLEALLAIQSLNDRHGHIQEIIIQNFRAKAGTRMSASPEPSLEEHLWTIAAARLIFGPQMTIQAPPNLRPGELTTLVRAGVNDWGGVSPVTPDHVNPEAPWPHLSVLAAYTAQAGRTLVERLAISPKFALDPVRWADEFDPSRNPTRERDLRARALLQLDRGLRRFATGGSVRMDDGRSCPTIHRGRGDPRSRQGAPTFGRVRHRPTVFRARRRLAGGGSNRRCASP